MSMERVAEVLEMPTQKETDVAQARKLAQGRAAVERYVERLENATGRLSVGPEASELYCALAELREGMIENDPEHAAEIYRKALESFALSHTANLGLRRLSREQGKFAETADSIERELSSAKPERKRELQLELARTYLYCMQDAEKAIAILEILEDTPEEDAEAAPKDEANGEDAAKPAPKFDAETFLLWEDALMASGAWDRYEEKLREALRQQKDIGAMTQHLEERMWMLYRCILPDENQAAMLCAHLMKMQPLDDELTEDELRRSQNSANRDSVVAVLKRAIERLQGSSREKYYRSLLADISACQFEDPDHAMDILAEDSADADSDLLLLHQRITLMIDSGSSDALLDAMAHTLELVATPELKAEQLYRIACILRDEMDQEEAAIDVLCEANELSPAYESVIEALSAYYSREGQWDKLSQLYEYELTCAADQNLPGYTDEVLIARHARLANLYETRLHSALNAFNHYHSILELRPDDLIALKGASRMSQYGGNWTELLKLYGAAEGCTQDQREHAYLLERIAQVADVYLNDAGTACMALEALRELDPNHSNILGDLARLYVKLKKWDALIALTDKEIASGGSAEYCASLLCRNAEVSENCLSNIPQAIAYYEKARSVYAGCSHASAELARIYEQEKSWDKLADLLRNEAGQTADMHLKCAYFRRLAVILDDQLDDQESAIEVYETCLRLDNTDTVSRRYLLDYYRGAGKWEDALRILEIEAETGGTLGAAWLTHFWMGRIKLYRLQDEHRALESFQKALELNPDHMIIFRTWLSLSLRSGDDAAAKAVLEKTLETAKNEEIRDDIVLALADIAIRETHDPRMLEPILDRLSEAGKSKSRGSRFLTTMLVAMDAANGRWISRLSIALQSRQAPEIQKHALLASAVLNFPDQIRKRSQDVLCAQNDMDLARSLWSTLPPVLRPSFTSLPKAVMAHPSREAQALRRWNTISRLLTGDISDPTDRLLPDTRDESLSYRPDLELLAAYFERFEKWDKLLEVLHVQEENTRNEQESIQVTLQKAWVLSKIRKPEEALATVREACERCSFDNPMRLSLYDYLSKQKDWDFLSEQIRQHLMHSSDSQEKSALWMRIANINLTGVKNLEEGLRCLNHAYQETPDNGSILLPIANTAQAIGEYDIARRALDDYIENHSPTLDDELKIEPQLLELHFNYPGGDTSRMIIYFDSLVRRTVQSRDCLIILARAHALAGDPQIAAEILLRVMPYPFDENDVDLWIILADLYIDKLGEQKKGEALLWQLFQEFPCKEGVFDRLDKLYVKPVERRIMAENLQRSVEQSKAISAAPKLIRQYLGYAAQILGSELGSWKEAQELYSRALDASEDSAPELVKNRAYARCRVPGEALSAYREFCDLLVHDPFQADIYRAAFDICRRNDARDRERILRQLAGIFIPDAGLSDDMGDIRPKMMDSRKLSDDFLIQHLTHPTLRPAQILLHEAMPILSGVLRDLVPKRTNLGGEKIRDITTASLFSTCAAAFGVTNVRGFIGHDESPMPTVLDDPSAYWISEEAWSSMRPDRQRHWAGYASALLWSGISRMIWFDPREVWRLLDGCYYLVTNNGIEKRDAYTLEAAERVNSPFQRSTRRDIARIIDEIGPQNIPLCTSQGWIDGLLATADRAGLLFSGSLASSIPAILEAEGWNPDKKDPDYLASRFKISRRLPQIIEFALSDDYLALRFHAGLSMQTSTISG